MSDVPRVVAILGAGAIGGGWAALFAARGALVRLVDPDPLAMERAQQALACARRLAPSSDARGRIEAVGALADAVRGADWVQESLPESLALKRQVLAGLTDHLGADTIVASSTSTFTPGELSQEVPFAARLLVVHPLHPVYAVSVVELCANSHTSMSTIERAMRAMRALGREPILVRGDLPGLVANRLTAALLREAFDLVGRGVVSVEELDRIVARGIALGWATVGPLATESLGSGSVESFLDRYAVPLSRLWQSLANWHTLDDAGRDEIARALRAAQGARDEVMNPCAWAEALVRLVGAAQRER